jgi:hypothetical protein
MSALKRPPTTSVRQRARARASTDAAETRSVVDAVRPMATPSADRGEPGTAREWWMLVHQLPPDPPGLRMRVWRRLRELGALQIKGSVYILPATDSAREDLQWLLGEIWAANADASLWRAGLVEGFVDEDLVLRFQAAAAADYEVLEADARNLRAALKSPERRASTADTARQFARLRARFEEIGRRDHFEAPRREIVGALLADVDLQLQEPTMNVPIAPAMGTLDRESFHGRIWVTRAKVHVDRMASAWLINRFIDPDASFVFTDDARRSPVPGGLRFDMYGGEFTHEGDLCTFEVLLRRFALSEPGLERIAQLVHDIDLKESRYAHAETSGVAASLDAIAEGAVDDPARVAMAGTVFDGLLRRFARGR